MAARGEQDEYESDPDNTPLPSLRRREASDDEDGEVSDSGGKAARKGPRAAEVSDGELAEVSDRELDEQGGAQVYDDEEGLEEEDGLEEYYDEEEEFGEEEELEVEGAVIGHCSAAVKEDCPKNVQQTLEYEDQGDRAWGSVGDAIDHGNMDQLAVDEENVKEIEPYAVPTAGAFYMHDDRFQENARGRRRRMFGARKLWDAKDEKAWVHDRFEEMNLQESRYDENNRRPRDRFRGRGGSKSRGVDRGYGRGSRFRAYNDAVNNQNRVSRSVRGRGPRRYEALPKSSKDIPASAYRQSAAKPQESATNSCSKKLSQSADVQTDPIVPQKQVFASSLNYASPPFYPSGTSNSNQDLSSTQERDAQAGNGNKNLSNSMLREENSQTTRSSALLKGKTFNDSVRNERLFMDDTHRPVVGKVMGSAHLQTYGLSLSPDNIIDLSSSRVRGTSLSSNGPPNNQLTSSLNQGKRLSVHIQQSPAETPLESAVRVPAHQYTQRSGSGNHKSSPSPPPPPLPSADSSEVGETDSPPGSSKSRNSLVGKGKTGMQGTGRSSILFNGAHVLGSTAAMSIPHGDQNFPGTPAILPVMQFGAQHPGGLGVPAVGMAVPGYVAQPGFGNSEMTWVPVLASMPGSLGTPYCPPYITLDGNYYGRHSGQTSASVPSKETPGSKPATPMSQSDSVVDEAGRRQNKPRRYSEMNFGQ